MEGLRAAVADDEVAGVLRVDEGVVQGKRASAGVLGLGLVSEGSSYFII